MKLNRVMLVALVGVVAGYACAPTSPARAAEFTPQHHNIPATFAGHPEGPVIYLCAIQPRIYVVGGVSEQEEDHYLQYEQCPATPIK